MLFASKVKSNVSTKTFHTRPWYIGLRLSVLGEGGGDPK
jgi:hypothetical protein